MTNDTPVRPAHGSDAYRPARLGPITLRNRIIKASTYEGLTPEGEITDRLIDFHRRIAAGGVAMSTLAYLAVSDEGRGAPKELVLDPRHVPGLRRLAEAVRGEGARMAAQIGHAGAVATSARVKRPLAPSRRFSALGGGMAHAATEDDIARITRAFRSGTTVLRDAGFDAVEIHLGHGYLLSEFLSPQVNRRTDRWGGSLENRARFARQVAEAVRDGAGDGMAVTVKLNIDDGVDGGFWLVEAIQTLKWLEADGYIDAAELTCGSSLQNPIYLFRGEAPVHEMTQTAPRLLRPVYRAAAKRLIRSYPYEDMYLLDYARQVRAQVDLPLILLGGISSGAHVERAMEEGFEFVAMGRSLLRQPDLPNALAAGDEGRSLCIHCNKCMATIYSGSHCVLLEPAERPGWTGTTLKSS